MRLMWYDFEIRHVPGRDLYTADTLSRAPTQMPSKEDIVLQSEATLFVNYVSHTLPASDQRLDQIRSHQWEDETCREIVMCKKVGQIKVGLKD